MGWPELLPKFGSQNRKPALPRQQKPGLSEAGPNDQRGPSKRIYLVVRRYNAARPFWFISDARTASGGVPNNQSGAPRPNPIVASCF